MYLKVEFLGLDNGHRFPTSYLCIMPVSASKQPPLTSNHCAQKKTTKNDVQNPGSVYWFVKMTGKQIIFQFIANLL